MKKVMVGISGGVDSFVSALLLKKQGYFVTGVTLKLIPDDILLSSKIVENAKICCDKLGIEHIVLDFSSEFKTKVIDYFVNSYVSGKTPNPCVVCNKNFKFGAMLREAVARGYDYIATGHYSRVVYENELKKWSLKKALSNKDQSYFLYCLTQNILARTLMPLGDYTKQEVREIAYSNHFDTVAKEKDSQDVCFIQGINYKDFIRRYNIKNADCMGYFKSLDGIVLGEHKGIINYTIGQRKGLGISFGKPMYVIRLDAENNVIYLADEAKLFSKRVIVSNLNFIMYEKLEKPIRAYVKIRYNMKEKKALISPIGDKVEIMFDEPVRAVTPGQVAVIYDEYERVIGGGIID